MVSFATLVLSAILTYVSFGVSVEQGINDADVLESDTVLLTCHLDDVEDHIILWYYGTESTTPLSVWREITGTLDTDRKSRYSIEGSSGSENFNLRIRNVRKRDAGRYSCAYLTRTNKVIYLSSGILTVHSLPEDTSPVCESVNIKAKNNKTVRYVDLLCIWQGSETTDLRGTWYRDGVPVTSQVTSSSSVSHQRMLTKMDRNVNFTCVITSPYSSSWSRSCTIVPLRNKNLTVRLEPSVLEGKVGDNVTFKCLSEGANSFSWSLDPSSAARFLTTNRFELSKGNRFLTLKDIGEEDNGTKIACVAYSFSGARTTAHGVLYVSTYTNESATTSVSPVTIAFAVAPPTADVKFYTAIGVSVLLAVILLLVVALVIREIYGNRRKVSRVNDAPLSRQREVLRGSVRVDSEVFYHSISGEPRDGTENVNQEWTINIDNRGGNPLEETSTYLSDHDQPPSKNEEVKKFPLYAKPNKRRKMQSQRQIILSINSDVINFYENVSKHSSLTSQISRYSAQCSDSDNIYESVPQNYILRASNECLSEASDLYATIGEGKKGSVRRQDTGYASADTGEHSNRDSLECGQIGVCNQQNNTFEPCLEDKESI